MLLGCLHNLSHFILEQFCLSLPFQRRDGVVYGLPWTWYHTLSVIVVKERAEWAGNLYTICNMFKADENEKKSCQYYETCRFCSLVELVIFLFCVVSVSSVLHPLIACFSVFAAIF